jgi:hypothetical protein
MTSRTIRRGAVRQADPDAGQAPGELQFMNDRVAVGSMPKNGYRAMVAGGYSDCDLRFGVGQLTLLKVLQERQDPRPDEANKEQRS